MTKKLKMWFFTNYFPVPFLNMWIGKVTGLKNIPKDRAFIIAPNHNSYIDHFLIGAILVPLLNKKMCIIAKKEHFSTMMERIWYKCWNKYVSAIPIDRSKGQDALKAAASYLKNGEMLVLYPEGTRSLTGKIQRGKTGVARLALWTRVPVIPLGIIGTFEILPKGKKIPKFRRATMNIGKPIYFQKYYYKNISKRMLREITNEIMKEIAKLSNQKYNFK